MTDEPAAASHEANWEPNRELPRFAMPDVVGMAMPPNDIAKIVQSSVEEMMLGLDCERMAALSYASPSRLLRGVTTAGFQDPSIRDWQWTTADFPAVERCIRMREILMLPAPSDFPAEIAPHFSGQVIFVPLILGDRTLAVLVGQLRPNVPARSNTWLARAHEVAGRAALVVELERLATAYQDGLRIRQASRLIAAAILEGRPFHEIAEQIVEIVAERIREERLALFVGTTGNYRAAARRNISDEYADGIVRLPRPSPVVARAVASGLPYYAKNLQSDPQIPQDQRTLFRRERISTLLMALLQQEQTVTGALVAYPLNDRQFTPAELNVFQSFADQAAVAYALSQQMAQQREVAMGEERNRLAREMHDTVAQSLSALVLQIETVEMSLDSGDVETARERVRTARLQARTALEDTRRAVKGLQPSSLERLSTAEAIAELAASFEEEEHIPAPFILTGEEQPLLPEQQTALLRIAQEALTNARKYARASRVRVGLQFAAETVTLMVEDDGLGFDTEAPALTDADGGGYGLFGMRERARLLDGEIQIDSTPGWGTRLRTVLPYRPASSLSERQTARTSERDAHQPSSAQAPPVQNHSGPSHTGPSYASSPHASPSHSEPEHEWVEDPLRVLIADDHAVTREGVRLMLEASGEVRVIGEASDGAEAVAETQRLHPDVVLMDLQMPGVDGLEGTRRLRAANPEVPVVILTSFETGNAVSDALAAGARGYLLKDAGGAELLAAVKAAARGEAHLGPAVTDRLATLAVAQSTRAAPNADGINERDLEMLELLAQGARNKEIATALFVTTKTVEYHLANLFSKLGASNRTEAVRLALEQGIVSSAPRPIRDTNYGVKP